MSVKPGTPTFTLLCLNTRGLPIDCDAEERGRKLAEYVLAKDYDVLCLQEVFHEGAREQWVEVLSPHYPHMIQKTDQSLKNFNSMLFFLKEDSGMLIASKFPITYQAFQPWAKQSGPDWAANKGILCVRLDLSSRQPGASCFVVNCHMDSDAPWIKGQDAHNDRPLRNAQLKQIADFAAHHTHDAFFVLGDFNIIGDKTEESKETLPILKGKTNTMPRDLFRLMHPDAKREPGFTWDPTINKLAAANSEANKSGADLQERLDYIVDLDDVTKVHKCDLFLTGPTSDSQLSDHFGVLATLGCEGKNNVPGEVETKSGCCTVL